MRIVNALCDALESAAVQLHSARGRLALWAAVAAIPDDEDSRPEERQAARLLLAHAAMGDDDEDLAQRGIGDFEQAAIVVNALDKVPEVVAAVVGVWLTAHIGAATLALRVLQPD